MCSKVINSRPDPVKVTGVKIRATNLSEKPLDQRYSGDHQLLTDSNIALLIDYENVGIDSMQNLVEELSGMGRIIVKRAYADWSTQRRGQEVLIELGVEAVHNYRGNRSGKNSCDIKLTIDAVELLHSAQVDTFVIVSSDSDFVPLVNHLRGSGKSVIGAGRRDVTSTTMVKSCDRYIFLGLDVGRTQSHRTNGPKRPSYRNKRAPSDSGTIHSDSVPKLLARAVETTMDDAGNALGTRLAQTMTRIDPSFNYRDLGHRSFREFLFSRDEINVTIHEGTDFTVSLKSMDPNNKLEGDSKSIIPIPPRVSPRIINQKSVELEKPLYENDHSSDVSEESDVVSTIPDDWEVLVNNAWENRDKETIYGQSAAREAAKILGFKRLRDSIYPTIDKLLGASKLLKSNWTRDKNYVIKNK